MTTNPRPELFPAPAPPNLREEFTADQGLHILTLWQPWASLMAWGEKRVETRSAGVSWRNFRGWVAIHSSINRQAARRADVANESHLVRALIERKILESGSRQPAPWMLPFGVILAVVRFDYSERAEEAAQNLSDRELEHGDYEPGRLAFFTSCRQPLRAPIPWKGTQGLATAPLWLAQEVERELAR